MKELEEEELKRATEAILVLNSLDKQPLQNLGNTEMAGHDCQTEIRTKTLFRAVISWHCRGLT